MLCRQRQG
ncbi:hypothetical protein YPPY72_0238, partial [Yersinia pestis PY-72]